MLGMADIGDNMADRGMGGALSRENRATFRDVYATPGLWQQMGAYGSGRSEEWPDFRINPATGKQWERESETIFMEMLMSAFKKQEDERRLGDSTTKKTQVTKPIEYGEELPSTAGPGYIKPRQ